MGRVPSYEEYEKLEERLEALEEAVGSRKAFDPPDDGDTVCRILAALQGLVASNDTKLERIFIAMVGDMHGGGMDALDEANSPPLGVGILKRLDRLEENRPEKEWAVGDGEEPETCGIIRRAFVVAEELVKGGMSPYLAREKVIKRIWREHASG